MTCQGVVVVCPGICAVLTSPVTTFWAGASPRIFDGGGADSGESKPPTPKFDFSSDSAHFILEILKNLKK